VSSNFDRLAASHRSYDIMDSLLPSLRASAAAGEHGGVGQLLDDIFFSDDEENAPRPRLPLFSRCPLTNRAQLETPSASSGGKMKSASLR
jgi:hypothetical protein